MHSGDFDFSFVQFSNQAVKGILGDTVYAAYSLFTSKKEKHKKTYFYRAGLKKEPLRTKIGCGSARSLFVVIG